MSFKFKFMYFVLLLFLLLNVAPITIVNCNKEQNICKCTQIFRLLEKPSKKYHLKQIKLSDIQKAIQYRQITRYGHFCFQYGIGIETKNPQRKSFRFQEKGDYIIPNYGFKIATDKFVNKFNNYIEKDDKNNFIYIHLHSLFIIAAIIIGLIIFV